MGVIARLMQNGAAERRRPSYAVLSVALLRGPGTDRSFIAMALSDGADMATCRKHCMKPSSQADPRLLHQGWGSEVSCKTGQPDGMRHKLGRIGTLQQGALDQMCHASGVDKADACAHSQRQLPLKHHAA